MGVALPSTARRPASAPAMSSTVGPQLNANYYRRREEGEKAA